LEIFGKLWKLIENYEKTTLLGGKFMNSEKWKKRELF